VGRLRFLWLAPSFLIVATAVITAAQTPAPQISSYQRGQMRQMLRTVQAGIRNDYYDPTFGGLNLSEHFRTAERKIETVDTVGRGYAVIAQALVDLNDSHTFFLPPNSTTTFEYGWQMAMVADRCLVTGVKPGSDAEAKGLRAGDRIVDIETVPPTRADLWKMRYSLHTLYPRRRVKLLVETPGAAPRPLEIETKITPGLKELRIDLERLLEGMPTDFDDISVKRVNRFGRLGSVAVWRLEAFDIPPDQVDKEFDAVVKGATDLILDLRGNPGGYVKTLEQLAGRFFERDVKISDMKTRKSVKASTTKARKNPFLGRVVVLADSESASAAEIFARLMQIEKRGVIIGDRTAGAVMVGETRMEAIPLMSGSEDIRILPYGYSVTVADLIMTDGKSLERVGVMPDELLLPTPDDLAARRDPVLARAAALLGAPLDAAAAGQLFPLVWR
jgi:C-terminal processing protease CtpA/Prc